MTAPTRFEDRLLEQLQEMVAARPAPAPPRRRARSPRLALAGGGVAAATAVIALVVSGGDVTPSAYALESGPDGSVTVEIRSLRDAAGLERGLRAAGIPAEVDYSRGGCIARAPEAAGAATGGIRRGDADAGPRLSGPGPAPGADSASTWIEKTGDGVRFTIDPGTLERDEKVFITTAGDDLQSLGMTIGGERPATPCPAP